MCFYFICCDKVSGSRRTFSYSGKSFYIKDARKYLLMRPYPSLGGIAFRLVYSGVQLIHGVGLRALFFLNVPCQLLHQPSHVVDR